MVDKATADGAGDRIEVDLAALHYQDGSNAVHDMAPYYVDFTAFVRDPVVGAARYRARLLADDAVTGSTRYRGACILAARKFAIGYDEARHIVEFMDLSLTPESAVDLVLENYLAMAASGERFAVYAIVDGSGRFRVMEGLHRLSINIANGHLTCPVNILGRS